MARDRSLGKPPALLPGITKAAKIMTFTTAAISAAATRDDRFGAAAILT